MEELEKTTKLKFAYQSNLIDTTTTYTFNSCNLPVDGILHEIFDYDSLEIANLSDKIIVIKKRPGKRQIKNEINKIINQHTITTDTVTTKQTDSNVDTSKGSVRGTNLRCFIGR